MSTGKARSIELKARSKPQYMGESRLPRLMDRQQKVMFVTQLLQSILGTVRWFSETMQQQTWDGMRTSRRFTEVRKVGYGMIPSHLGLIVRRTYTWKSSSLRPSDRQATFRWDLQLTLWQSNVCPATQDFCDANPGTYAENQECSNFRLRGFPAWEDLKYLSTWAVSSSRQTSDLFLLYPCKDLHDLANLHIPLGNSGPLNDFDYFYSTCRLNLLRFDILLGILLCRWP